MDPNLFHIDWARTGEVLVAIIIMSFLLERALSLLFESRFFIRNLKDRGLKEIISIILCAAVCIFWKFDAVSMIFLKESTTIFGAIITGAVVAGGSKASIELFRHVMGIMSLEEKLRIAGKERQINNAKNGGCKEKETEKVNNSKNKETENE